MGNPLGLRADPSIIDPLLGLAARQYSLLSRGQWLASGLTERQLARAIQNRAVFAVHPGVYALGAPRGRSSVT